MYNINSLKENHWLRPSYNNYIVHMAILRHNTETIVNFTNTIFRHLYANDLIVYNKKMATTNCKKYEYVLQNREYNEPV